MISLTIPIRLTNPLNSSQGLTRGAAMGAARKRKNDRGVVRCVIGFKLGALPAGYASKFDRVRIVRIGPGTMDDDGLAAACKSVRDGIADALGINDRQPKGFWDYAQEKQGKGVYAVRIELMEVGDV